jgi:hypothetical protein
MRRGGRDRCGITRLILTHEAAVDVHLGMPNQRDSFMDRRGLDESVAL